VMRAVGDGADGARLRALIVILWRAGLRIGEALDLAETDLDAARGAVLVRRGKGGRRREVGMDRWAWSQLEPWLAVRRELPVGALLCVIRGATAGRHWEPSAVRKQLSRTAAKTRVCRRSAPRQLRQAHAVETAHEGGPLRHPRSVGGPRTARERPRSRDAGTAGDSGATSLAGTTGGRGTAWVAAGGPRWGHAAHRDARRLASAGDERALEPGVAAGRRPDPPGNCVASPYVERGDRPVQVAVLSG
jgi:hypothetical protein